MECFLYVRLIDPDKEYKDCEEKKILQKNEVFKIHSVLTNKASKQLSKKALGR